MSRTERRRALAGLVISALVVGGCAGPILANDPAVRPTTPPATATPPRPPDPLPVELPRDDGPHDRLTEWWYDTGHLVTAEGRRFGFEFVIFRAERGGLPVSWASHLAVTDELGGRFAYAQRVELGPGVDRSPRGPDGRPTGFDLAIAGTTAPGSLVPASPPPGPSTAGRSAWTMSGAAGTDRLVAALAPAEATAAGVPGGLELELSLATNAPAVLHDRDGWIDFGAAGGSYYYSRTRLAAAGRLVFDGQAFDVTGQAWFDHQWGDFIAIGGGGWDWFAVNLDDGTDLTVSLVRDVDGSYPLVYGTLVAASGAVRHLDRDAFAIVATGTWRSPRTGAEYPAGWRISVPSEALTIELEPTVADQELDSRATTGVVYWEGSQRVVAIRAGVPVAGQAYVELTGYAAKENGRDP